MGICLLCVGRVGCSFVSKTMVDRLLLCVWCSMSFETAIFLRFTFFFFVRVCVCSSFLVFPGEFWSPEKVCFVVAVEIKARGSFHLFLTGLRDGRKNYLF